MASGETIDRLKRGREFVLAPSCQLSSTADGRLLLAPLLAGLLTILLTLPILLASLLTPLLALLAELLLRLLLPDCTRRHSVAVHVDEHHLTVLRARLQNVLVDALDLLEASLAQSGFELLLLLLLAELLALLAPLLTLLLALPILLLTGLAKLLTRLLARLPVLLLTGLGLLTLPILLLARLLTRLAGLARPPLLRLSIVSLGGLRAIAILLIGLRKRCGCGAEHEGCGHCEKSLELHDVLPRD